MIYIIRNYYIQIYMYIHTGWGDQSWTACCNPPTPLGGCELTKSDWWQSKGWRKCGGGRSLCCHGDHLPPSHRLELCAGQDHIKIGMGLSITRRLVSRKKSSYMMSWTGCCGERMEKSDPSGMGLINGEIHRQDLPLILLPLVHIATKMKIE
jgi:hypothetical protein